MEYRLRWESFQTWTKESMKDLYQDNDYTDVTLITEDHQVFKSHRIILSSSSDFFNEILRKMKSFQGQTLYLKEIQGNILSLLLNFIYLGEVTVNQELIRDFLSTAVDLKIKGIDFEEKKDILKDVKKVEIQEDTSDNIELSTLEEIDTEIKKPSDSDVTDSSGDKMSGKSKKDERRQIQKSSKKNKTRKLKQEKLLHPKKEESNSSEGKSDSNNSEAEFICIYDTCNERFKTSKQAKKHILKTHSRQIKEKTVPCETCSKKFQTKHEAKIHWQFKHGNKERMFSCEVCEKKFFQSGDLKMHNKGVHLKIKDFHCTFCDFSFSQHCNLKTHMIKIHTEKYYNQLKGNISIVNKV